MKIAVIVVDAWEEPYNVTQFPVMQMQSVKFKMAPEDAIVQAYISEMDIHV